MKRWAVFDTPDYYPGGGMSDFVSAFDTREEAELFISRTLDRGCLHVEDMFIYLNRSPLPIPSEQEFQEKVAARRIAHEESMKNPINKAIHELMLSMHKSMYGDGSTD